MPGCKGFKGRRWGKGSAKPVVASMQKYVQQYALWVSQEHSVERDVLISDLLYGLGVALDRSKYSFASGFEQFQSDLFEFLKSNSEIRERPQVLKGLKCSPRLSVSCIQGPAVPVRCGYCGRFISDADLESGAAEVDYTPDTQFTAEEDLYICARCGKH